MKNQPTKKPAEWEKDFQSKWPTFWSGHEFKISVLKLFITEWIAQAKAEGIKLGREETSKKLSQFNIDNWLTEMCVNGERAYTAEELEDWMEDLRVELLKHLTYEYKD